MRVGLEPWRVTVMMAVAVIGLLVRGLSWVMSVERMLVGENYESEEVAREECLDSGGSIFVD